jgi:lipoprotein signal peptidase
VFNLTQEELNSIIKKHTGFAVFLALVPVVFTQVISIFAGDMDHLLIFLMPIIIVGACANLVKNVLTDIREHSHE